MPSGGVSRVLVINRGSPELNNLAAFLSVSGRLSRYVRPYVNKGRAWERLVSRAPALSSIYRKTIGRREVPGGLDKQSIEEAGVVLDFLHAAAGRLGRNVKGGLVERAVDRLDISIKDIVAQTGARSSQGCDCVIATNEIALPAFRAVDGMKILNYQLPYHEHYWKVLQEEAALDPAFAGTSDLSKMARWERVYRAVVHEEIALADRILVGSSFARRAFVESGLGADKICVVPYGVDIEGFSPPAPSAQREPRQGFDVIFVGTIGQRKGIRYLLDAYAAFRDSTTTLTLVGNVVGDASVLDPYRPLLRHVRNVPRRDLPTYYHQADVFVFPTLAEGMPLVVVEAMACGLPVITTPCGPDEVVRDGIDGFIVPPRDADAIVEKLRWLRDNPERRRDMGRSARARAQEFSWERYCSRVMDVISEGVEGS